MGFVITSDQLVWFFGFITALCTFIAGIWKIIKELRKPNQEVKEKLIKHDKLLDTDNKRLKEIEDSNHMVLQCLLSIINHDITGNGIERMKEIRDDLQDFLIRK